ncbi:MAG TPA: lactate racemase domain-containing protein [Candidatus Sulfotelmatobacter sp.]|jgi:nickel-dependent lactate racemase|nr:lactate racemase domain-containing protein [Candidatus Sulfotelmatobacter sp.]
MSVYCAVGSPETELSPEQLKDLLAQSLTKLGLRKRVIVVPPDMSRLHSRAGELTRYAWQFYGERLQAVLPAVGTHNAMNSAQIERMFGAMPRGLFQVHNWRTDTETLGEVPAEFVHEQSECKLNYAWPAQVNRLIVNGEFDLILSIGQVVPHEVIGMANYNKNILVGTGGPEGINRSHYLGAVYGMERIMGRAENPVRNVLNYAADHFLKDQPIVYVLTVVGRAESGRLVLRGLFIGDDVRCFHSAAELSLKVNFEILEAPIQKAVVYLDGGEFQSTWLGNKAVYRTRMALADGAELIVLGPGVKQFGEDPAIDKLIRKYGYHGTPATLAAVSRNTDLARDLSAAAHLIHGSSEARFTIRWCPGHLSQEEIEGAGYSYGDPRSMLMRYPPEKLKQGYNRIDGEEVFFIADPGMGLWAYRGKLSDERQRK